MHQSNQVVLRMKPKLFCAIVTTFAVLASFVFAPAYAAGDNGKESDKKKERERIEKNFPDLVNEIEKSALETKLACIKTEKVQQEANRAKAYAEKEHAEAERMRAQIIKLKLQKELQELSTDLSKSSQK